METSILQWKEGASVRMQMVDGEPWFIAKDLCEILGLENVSKALVPLDTDEKHGVTISNVVGKNQ